VRIDRFLVIGIAALAVSGLARADDLVRDPRDQPRWFQAERRLRDPMASPVERAEDPRDPLPSVSADELDERQAFVDRVLAANARNTRLWFGFYTQFYGAAMAAQAARAATQQDPAERADTAYSAAKGAVGVIARMAYPPRAVFGPAPVDLYPGTSHAARARRLLAAEAMLRRDARDSDRRYLWVGHVINATLNLTGALIVGIGFHDWQRGVTSAAIGLGIGELSIWTQPWTAKRGYRGYLARYGSFF